MSFAKLKRGRKGQIDKLKAKAEEQGGKNYGDDRKWKPARDKAGNGFAIIRFLPSKEDSGTPYVRYWDHGFQGKSTGQWYIENSLTSLGQGVKDPVGELNSRLWNVGDKTPERQQARDQKRRLHYVSNIYVVSDPANPANEGKVFLYEYGKKIFDKLEDAWDPKFPGEIPIDPFDMWGGADFQVKVRIVDDWVNYDKSEFSKPSELLGGDEKALEEVYNQMYTLEEFIDPKNYKSYDELHARLMVVLGETAGMGNRTMNEEKQLGQEAEPKTLKSSPPKTAEELSSDDGDEKNDLSYFENLISED